MLAILSWCEFLRVPFGPVAKMSAQSSLFWRVFQFSGLSLSQATRQKGLANARTNFYAARLARRQPQRAHTTLKGELRIRRDQQETPHAPQEAELRSWHRFGEAYSALRDWRPISGRSSPPIRLAMFREGRSFHLRTAQLRRRTTARVNKP